ncbi:MAG: hypothetical protein KTR26_08370 [Flammeovirgaceae bacterium]|nr:hypothetical protein [Flammeovirgaceae bacterium]
MWHLLSIFNSTHLFINTSYNYDSYAPFKDYKTSKVFPPTAEDLERMGVVMSPRLVLIESSITKEMTTREYNDSDSPDLAITNFVSAQTKEKTSSTYVGVGSYGGYGGMSYGFGTFIPNASYY